MIPKISEKTIEFFSKTYAAFHILMASLIQRLFSLKHCKKYEKYLKAPDVH